MRIMFVHIVEELVAVLARHLDVRDDRIDAVPFHQVERRIDAHGLEDRVFIRPEDRGQDPCGVRLIIDKEDRRILHDGSPSFISFTGSKNVTVVPLPCSPRILR